MKIEDIDEAQDLIERYRRVIISKKQLNGMSGKDGGSTEDFVIIEQDTKIKICLYGLKEESLKVIGDVLNIEYDNIVSKLKNL